MSCCGPEFIKDKNAKKNGKKIEQPTIAEIKLLALINRIEEVNVASKEAESEYKSPRPSI